MASPEHLDILKQGVDVWNQWREVHLDIIPDLSSADLSNLDLRSANFSYTNLSHSDLKYSNLVEAYLTHANLSHAFLINVPLMEADLSYTNLSHILLHTCRLKHADLSHANLSNAQTNETDFSYVNFEGADFREASFSGANFCGVTLSYVDFSNASVEYTIFAEVDLSEVKGLETVKQTGPSTIGMDTIILSHGKIPETFLRGAGVPPSIIEQIPALIGSLKPIDYYTCFISYSSKDEDFAKRLHADLQDIGVRCWFAPEDLKIGDRIRPRIDESIRKYDKLLIILSEHSVASKWVEFEVETAMDKEQEGKPPVLFPVRLDNTVMDSTTAWAAHIKRTRNIGDFTDWKNHDNYQKIFSRLLRDLKAGT
jgi:uncharacterized protein YjbI with pentapeptide repeats